MPRLRALALLSSLALVACRGGRDAATPAATAAPGGTVVIATPAEPDNLLPPITASASGRQVEDLVFEHLADIGTSLNTVGDAGFTPALAREWSWSADSLQVTFELDPSARFHDGHPVRATDVVFSVGLYQDPKTASPTASYLTNIDSVTATDSLTATVWFRRRTPHQFFDVAYQTFVLPRHLLESADRATLASSAFASAPVGSGPFRFVRWERGQSLELAADTTAGRRRAQLDRVLFTMAPDPVTAFTRVATGEADLFEAVRPDKVADVLKNPELRLVMMPSLQYLFLGFNQLDPVTGKPHPIFSDRAVRRALTMATDRRAIVANIYDTLATQSRGPFTIAQPNADATTPLIPYSLDSANALLDAAGWVRGADSIRTRAGRRLAFGIAVTSTSVPRMRAAVLLQEQFRRVGADVKVESSDMAGFMGRATAHKFDTWLGIWAADPGPGSVRDSWTTAGAGPGGNNYQGYRSAAFDAQVDSGEAAFAPAVMQRHFAAAWRIIADDAPAIWIAEPKAVMAIHKRIETTGMRPDAWWAGLAHWTIPAAARIARDVPAPAPAR
ncbi:MAG: peptide ABC transporter substrate-binding protein [Gemmatimonadaceae bacterium]|nr:peptide ABC transporter substrate-binding protein [Gemmatimonadaceae bacterium]